MGCQMQAVCQLPPTHPHELASQALANMATQFAQAEQRFSRFLPDSELSQLNQRRQMAVSEDFYQLLQHAFASAELTQGLITPTLLNPLLERGYRQNFSQLQPTNLAHAKTPNPLPNLQAWQTIMLEPNTKRITLPEDMGLDFGGFAKGLTAWQCAKGVAENSSIPVLIDAGGDIVTQGVKKAGLSGLNGLNAWQPWLVELPRLADMALPIQYLTPNSSKTCGQNLADWYCVPENSPPHELILPSQNSYTLATSGIDYRFWFDGDRLQHHLIDPTGSPHSDIVCASVLIEDGQNFTHPVIRGFLQDSNPCNLAQTLSKLFCLLGVTKSRDWQKRFELEHVGVSWIVCGSGHGDSSTFQQWLNPVMQGFCQIL